MPTGDFPQYNNIFYPSKYEAFQANKDEWGGFTQDELLSAGHFGDLWNASIRVTKVAKMHQEPEDLDYYEQVDRWDII